MSNGFHIMIPMTIVHICDQSTCSLWQVFRILLYAPMIGYGFNKNHLLSIGREKESLHFTLGVGELLAVGTVDIHAPHFASRAKSDSVVGEPSSIGLTLGRSGELLLVLPVSIHHI